MRVNARLDEATEQQIDYLMRVTGQSVSQVVRESVAQYYVTLRRGHPPSRFLAMAGQWRSGHDDTASQVKAVLADALDAKLPRSPGLSSSARQPARRKQP